MTKIFSLLRRLQYAEFARLTIDGRILDVGGARDSGYHELIRGMHTVEVANIAASPGVDMVFDAQERFPIEDAVYSGVILLNVLEHLFDYKNAVEESFRVLKPGGVLVGAVPFLFSVHASPDDYFRYTRSSLERIFRDAGYADIVIKELGTGAFSVIYHLLFGLYRFGFIKELVMRVCVFLDSIIRHIKRDSHMSERSMPLGYFFEAKKP